MTDWRGTEAQWVRRAPRIGKGGLQAPKATVSRSYRGPNVLPVSKYGGHRAGVQSMGSKDTILSLPPIRD